MPWQKDLALRYHHCFHIPLQKQIDPSHTGSFPVSVLQEDNLQNVEKNPLTPTLLEPPADW